MSAEIYSAKQAIELVWMGWGFGFVTGCVVVLIFRAKRRA